MPGQITPHEFILEYNAELEVRTTSPSCHLTTLILKRVYFIPETRPGRRTQVLSGRLVTKLLSSSIIRVIIKATSEP